MRARTDRRVGDSFSARRRVEQARISHAVPATLGSFWSYQLVLAIVLNLFLNAVQIGAYAARLAGVTTGRVGTSISLFNLFVTVSRFANMFYAPMLGSISDAAGKVVLNPALASAEVSQYAWQMRAIIFAATLGSIVGTLLLPTFTYIFVRAVAAFEHHGSMPRAIMSGLNVTVAGDILGTLRLPSPAIFSRFSIREVSAKLLVGNVVVTGIYAAGVVAAYLASVVRPEVARTALSASGLVNGVATIAFALVVDPTSALIVDKAVKGERSLHDVKTMVAYLGFTAVIGTLFSQAVLWPAALFIGGAAHLLNVRH